MTHQFLLTVDVEDWFQVENFKEYIPFSSWPSYELRVEKNTYRLLDLLDSIKPNTIIASSNPSNPSNSSNPNNSSNPSNPSNNLRATFFVLGWIAEKLPNLIREIHARGHEVASHGYNHNLCTGESYEELKSDLLKSKSLLEDITGTKVHGYRAPSFSVDHDILKIIEDCGYSYDSSFNSFVMHGRYGRVDLSSKKREGIAYKISNTFYEIPISNLVVGKIIFPWGGGGYFRLMPYPAFRCGVRSILTNDGAYMFYMHPWEIDPDQPRMEQASLFYKYRHYINIKKTEQKLKDLITDLDQCSFVNCTRYIEEIC
jgi:peptidoglycan-N-acetylglucosamine deacetylase